MRPSGTAYARFLRGDMKPSEERRAEAFRSWRATLPFTDEEFVAAFERLARAVEHENSYLANLYRNQGQWLTKTGRLNQKMVSMALLELIKTCSICGKKALYRTSSEGRCSKHRDIKSKYVIEKLKRKEQLHQLMHRSKIRSDDYTLKQQSFKSAAKGHGSE